MGYMQTSFTWSILFFTNVCKKINCFKVFRLTGAWTWDTKGWHTILCAYIKFLELAYNSMTLHKVPWACMQFHDLVCSCRLRLSSSQEFRSACYSRKFLWSYVPVLSCRYNLQLSLVLVKLWFYLQQPDLISQSWV